MDSYCGRIELPHSDWVLSEMLKVAYNDESNDERHYRRMAKRAKNYLDRKNLYSIADDERRHQRLLRYVNNQLGFAPLKYNKPEWTLWQGFCKELCKSLAGEEEGAEYYNEIMERIECTELKNIIKSIRDDEKRHAMMIKEMLDKCGKKKNKCKC